MVALGLGEEVVVAMIRRPSWHLINRSVTKG